MPVLHPHGDVHAVAGAQFHGGLAPFLVIAPSGHAQQDLSAALAGVVDVPVVAAARLKGHIEDPYLLRGHRGQIALPHKILGEGVVGGADGEDHLSGVGGLGIRRSGLLRPDLLCQVEHRPALGPSGVEGGVGDDGGHLLPGDAGLFGVFQVVFQGGVRDAGGHQGRHRHDASGLVVHAGVVPILTEENVVIVVGKGGGEGSQSRPARSLGNRFHMAYLQIGFDIFFSACYHKT